MKDEKFSLMVSINKTIALTIVFTLLFIVLINLVGNQVKFGETIRYLILGIVASIIGGISVGVITYKAHQLSNIEKLYVALGFGIIVGIMCALGNGLVFGLTVASLSILFATTLTEVFKMRSIKNYQ